MTMTRRRLLDDTFKKSVVGNPAIAQGSLARMYPGIVMQGWTEQAKTTGAQLFDASKIPSASAGGATLVNNGDGSFTISGEGSLVSAFDSMVNLSHEETVAILRAGDLYINAGQSGEPYFSVSIQNDSESVKKSFASFGSVTGKINVAEDDLADEEIYLRYGFYGRSGKAISNYIISPMIYQSGNGKWEPYTGGAPSPSPGYPQEIISAGSWNEDTQKWEYEITFANEQTDPDKNQTVTLTADRPLTKWDKLEKRNGQWGWVYGSVEADMSSEVTWVIHQGYEQETSNLFRGVMSGVNKIDSTDMLLCNILPYYQAASADVNGIYSLGNNLFARIVGIKSLEDFQERIQGGKVLTKLSTETFVPLTTTEQEAMEALHTYRPTTVLSNQQDCDMTLTYKSRKGMS